MKFRWFLTVALSVALYAPTVQASAGDLLYVVEDTSTIDSVPGLAVTGLPYVRRLSSFDDRQRLQPDELATLQANIVYRSLFTPGDPHFSLQWNLQTMNVPAAWDVDQTAPLYGGDPRIIVAVLDTGLASQLVGGSASVPDIAPATIWTNPDEIPGDGIDNDRDGYTDDLHGWNFVKNNALPIDDNGHGTHVSGVIAAGADNAMATAGIAYNVTIMPLKVLDEAGLGSTTTLTAAVNYAISHGADIINLSLGGDEDDPIFHQAIKSATLQGIIIVSAAGNSGAGTVTYPAQYSEVIGVGATNTDGTRAAYSNYGSALTLVAPGGDTGLDLNNDGQPDGIPSQTCATPACTSFATVYLSGTSQAASEVSAVAALLESCGAAPGNIRTLLTSSARDLGPAGRDDQFGSGQVDAAAALTAAGCVAAVPASPGSITGQASKSSTAAIVAKRPWPYVRPVFSWSGQSGVTFTVTWKKGSTVVTQTKQSAKTFTPVITAEANYTLTVVAEDALGQTSAPATFAYRYRKPVAAVSSGAAIILLKNDLKILRTIATTIGRALSVSAGSLNSTTVRLLVAAQPKGAMIALLDSQGKIIRTVRPFGQAFSGTITSTILQQADGTSLFVAATNSHGASLAWFSASGKLLGKNTVYSSSAGGLNLASGDLDGDGSDELIVAQTKGSEIRTYTVDRQRLGTFTPRGLNFRQGWSITAGDIDGDGRAEILATPNVAVAKAKILTLSGHGQEMRSWTAAGSPVGSLLLQAADLNGDGVSELLTAPQFGAGALQQLSGTGKLLKQIKLTTTTFRSLTRL